MTDPRLFPPRRKSLWQLPSVRPCSREGRDLLCLAVINALEALSAADRPVDRAGMDSENLLDLAHELERVSRLTVHLVYKGKDRDMAHHTDFEQFDGLRLDTL